MAFPDNIHVRPGFPVRLADFDPRDKLHFSGKDAAKAATAADAAAIDELQDTLYAEGRRALLVILQGMDTSGKDGTVRDVFARTGPLGVHVTSFRQPSEEERAHDFLWRVHRACPARGAIGIFNRSHYEDVLVVKVRNLAPAEEVERRYDQINAFEKMLVENGTTILKCMLHVSQDEQRQRLQARLDDPAKRWKFDAGDLDDRAQWDAFTAAYEAALTRCSTDWAPWHIIPADRKWIRSAAIAELVRLALVRLDPQYPVPAWDPAQYRVT